MSRSLLLLQERDPSKGQVVAPVFTIARAA